MYIYICKYVRVYIYITKNIHINIYITPTHTDTYESKIHNYK